MVSNQRSDLRAQAAEAVLSELREATQEQLDRQLQEMIREWRGEADRRLEAALSEVLAQATREVMRQANGQAGGAIVVNQSGGSVDGLGRAIGQVMRAALDEVLEAEKTRVRVEETRRSRAADQAFRESRGQTQAQLSREIARGQRNL